MSSDPWCPLSGPGPLLLASVPVPWHPAQPSPWTGHPWMWSDLNQEPRRPTPKGLPLTEILVNVWAGKRFLPLSFLRRLKTLSHEEMPIFEEPDEPFNILHKIIWPFTHLFIWNFSLSVVQTCISMLLFLLMGQTLPRCWECPSLALTSSSLYSSPFDLSWHWPLGPKLGGLPTRLRHQDLWPWPTPPRAQLSLYPTPSPATTSLSD